MTHAPEPRCPACGEIVTPVDRTGTMFYCQQCQMYTSVDEEEEEDEQ